MLDRIMDRAGGDIAVDVAGQRPPYHPHLSAPLIHKLLVDDGNDITGMTTIIVIRNPVDMLWSYFKFFKPDLKSRYTFVADHDGTQLMGFEDWVLRGRVGINPEARALGPDWVTPSDLSPLSLEAHALRRDGSSTVDHVFQIEEPSLLMNWLQDRTGVPMAMPHVNASPGTPLPILGSDAMAKIRSMFPTESRIYSL